MTLARQQMGRRAGRIRVAPLLVAAAVAIGFAGCGGEGEAQSSVPVPEDCLGRWNSETIAQEFGRHVYNTHDTRQAQVALLEPAEGAFNIPGGEACAVIFAVPESDFEYGDVGLVVTRLGWASMQELARGDQVALDQIQREASASPNAALFPDGSLEPN